MGGSGSILYPFALSTFLPFPFWLLSRAHSQQAPPMKQKMESCSITCNEGQTTTNNSESWKKPGWVRSLSFRLRTVLRIIFPSLGGVCCHSQNTQYLKVDVTYTCEQVKSSPSFFALFWTYFNPDYKRPGRLFLKQAISLGIHNVPLSPNLS